MKTGSHKRILTGVVISDKADKTVTVVVTRRYKHPLYKKMVTARKKYMAHDEQNLCKSGDRVRIRECAPVSARKRWLVVDKIEKSAAQEGGKS
ncbi:MAG TPA: 30S ribosomal protein S17 [bacterium]|nr:30S ribosomal protein S17 [bacterium]